MSGRPDILMPILFISMASPTPPPIMTGNPWPLLALIGSTFTYYYKVLDPGTYMYHCHIEATEHMQMGMPGNLYVIRHRTTCPMEPASTALPT